MKKSEKILIEVCEVNNNFVSKTNQVGLEKIKGEGKTVSDCVENLLLNIKQSFAQSEEEQVKNYIEQKMPFARQIVLDLYEKVGIESMTLNNIIKLTGEKRDVLENKLNFIKEFGFAKHDGTAGGGCKWELIIDRQSMIIHYINQANKFQATVNYFNNLAETLKKISEQEFKQSNKVENES